LASSCPREKNDMEEEEENFLLAPPPSPAAEFAVPRSGPRVGPQRSPPSIAEAAAAARGDLLTLPDLALKEYKVEKGPLRAWVTLRKDKRFKYVRIYDFLYEAIIEPHPELEKVVPGSGILTDLRDIIQEVSNNGLMTSARAYNASRGERSLSSAQIERSFSRARSRAQAPDAGHERASVRWACVRASARGGPLKLARCCGSSARRKISLSLSLTPFFFFCRFWNELLRL
jgi:hypothetical protein